MSENVKDTQRAFAAAKAILDGRDPVEERSAVLVMTGHAITAVLLACMDSDPRKAALMPNEWAWSRASSSVFPTMQLGGSRE
ncbi:hypothetical protein [Rhizobium leguminosarum]|uniref:hypothetical protein n=1 Tax=Rhizobium leguminosarum TaxID=384 RepID=UPI00195424A9|nr:hypothetical protein [Rhizobium leguminosarum]